MSPKPKYSEFLSIDNEQLKSLRDIAVESIREAIIGGLFKPGEHLKERELSQAMGISTTPIKEAFRILGHEGLVVTVPRKGTYVSEVVQSSMEEILMIKANLEGLCARLAAMKITDAELQALTATLRRMEESKDRDAEALARANTEFHGQIWKAARNPMLLNMLSNISAFDKAFRKRALQLNVEMHEGFNEHLEIFKAIQKRDPDAAEEKMKAHILRTARNVLHSSAAERSAPKESTRQAKGSSHP